MTAHAFVREQGSNRFIKIVGGRLSKRSQILLWFVFLWFVFLWAIRSEGARGQALLVHEVWHAFLVPGKSCCGRFGDFVAGDEDRVAVDGGLGFDELSVFARDFKPVEGLVVARGEPASGVIET